MVVAEVILPLRDPSELRRLFTRLAALARQGGILLVVSAFLAGGRDAFGLPRGEAPIELRWLAYRRRGG